MILLCSECSIYQSGQTEKLLPFTVSQIHGHRENFIISKNSLLYVVYTILNGVTDTSAIRTLLLAQLEHRSMTLFISLRTEYCAILSYRICHRVWNICIWIFRHLNINEILVIYWFCIALKFSILYKYMRFNAVLKH